MAIHGFSLGAPCRKRIVRETVSAAMKARWAKAKKTVKKATKMASSAKAVETASVG